MASSIATEIEEEGYNDKLKSYTRELKGNALDASLLMLALVGYGNANEPRIVSTCESIYRHLSENKLIYRYRNIDDGLSGHEGSFGVCNFWLAENLAKSGKLEKAKEVFEVMVEHASPTGLLSEEIDPETDDLLGNYPQAFTHIGLINAVLSINEAYQKGGKAT